MLQTRPVPRNSSLLMTLPSSSRGSASTCIGSSWLPWQARNISTPRKHTSRVQGPFFSFAAIVTVVRTRNAQVPTGRVMTLLSFDIFLPKQPLIKRSRHPDCQCFPSQRFLMGQNRSKCKWVRRVLLLSDLLVLFNPRYSRTTRTVILRN